MPFKKGHSGNPKGKKPGTTSEAIKELREKIYILVDANFETLQTEFEKLKGKDKLLVLDRLLRFVLPPPPPENLLDGMSDEDLDKLIEHLRKKIDK